MSLLWPPLSLLSLDVTELMRRVREKEIENQARAEASLERLRTYPKTRVRRRSPATWETLADVDEDGNPPDAYADLPTLESAGLL